MLLIKWYATYLVHTLQGMRRDYLFTYSMANVIIMMAVMTLSLAKTPTFALDIANIRLIEITYLKRVGLNKSAEKARMFVQCVCKCLDAISTTNFTPQLQRSSPCLACIHTLPAYYVHSL